MSFDRLDEDDDDRPRRRSREDDVDDEDDRPRRRRRDSEDYAEPHRGGLILALGIISLVACGPVGIAAWIMGSGDMKAMDEGRMDPEGRQLTQIGKILGIVACAIMAFVILLYGAIFIIAIAAGAAGA